MGVYRTIARPALFLLPPEASHRLAGAALALPLPWRALGSVPRDDRLGTDLAGIRVPNPIGLAAGFDKNARLIHTLARLGFGYTVAGTFTRRPRSGNPRPRIVRLPDRASLVNAMGLPNPGAAAAAVRLGKRSASGPRLASIADEEVEDAAEVHRLLEPLVDGIELNASCPNVSWGRDRDTEEHLAALVRALAPGKRRPLFVKLPPIGNDVERDAVIALASIAIDAGADGLTCGNTRLVDEPRLCVGRGGLSGAELRADTVSAVAQVRTEIGPDVPIQACGGIASGDDALACLEAGATTVQLYTSFVYQGPAVLRDICRRLLDSSDIAATTRRVTPP
ncbi:MAG: dihydroorotate dehydrogenase 2 [Actinomycetota bacterium]